MTPVNNDRSMKAEENTVPLSDLTWALEYKAFIYEIR